VLSEAAEARSDPAARATAALRLEWIKLLGSAGMQKGEARIHELARRFEDLDHEPGLAEALLIQGTVLSWRGRCAGAIDVHERAAALARKVGHHRVRSRSLSWMLIDSY
jgi:hypothetical protein